MKRTLAFLLIAAMCTTSAQQKERTNSDEAAIKQAALDYAEGFYEGNADRMERAVDPLLIKRGLFISRLTGSCYLNEINSEMLIEITRTGRGKLDPAQRNIRCEVLDKSDYAASAKIFTARFNDYLHLVKENGRWRLVNVLWTNPVPQPTTSLEKEQGAIRKAIDDFQAAIESKDADGVARLIYPGLTLRTFREIVPGGKKIIQEMNADVIVEAVRSGRTAGQPKASVTVLDVYENMASIKLSTDKGGDYLHMAKLDGQWKIVNGLTF